MGFQAEFAPKIVKTKESRDCACRVYISKTSLLLSGFVPCLNFWLAPRELIISTHEHKSLSSGYSVISKLFIRLSMRKCTFLPNSSLHMYRVTTLVGISSSNVLHLCSADCEFVFDFRWLMLEGISKLYKINTWSVVLCLR